MTDESQKERGGAIRAVFKEPVALGLALMLFVRPWRDGVTFKGWDAYFIWVAIALAALWGARMLLRGEPIRNARAIALFGVFLGVVLLTSFNTFQFDATYRAVLIWWCYFLVFALAANALKSRLAIGIVVGALIATSLPNAVWAILHMQYTLPFMRQAMRENPALLESFGMTGGMSPELEHRLESNRAFGTLLYPNALAAYLVLVIPVAIGYIAPAWSTWREAMQTAYTPRSRQAKLYASAALGLCVWFFMTAAAFFLYPFLLLLVTQDTNWAGHPLSATFYLLVLPVGAGAFSVWMVRRHGPRGLGTTIALIGLAGTAAVGPITLWLTYSRGGLLAFGFAILLTATLLIANKRGLRLPSRAAAASLVFVIGVAAMAGVERPVDAQAPAAIPDQDVAVEGRPQDLEALADPSTLKLRLSYWTVGWRMFLDNAFTGVGLGNFGTAYGNYQYIGAGPTQTAHNVLVKVLSETGVFGFLAFCAFWGYVLVWGGLRILREENAVNRWSFAGLYCGVLAFFLHSLLDFNFANSALALPAFCIAGLMFARKNVESPADAGVPARSKVSQIVALELEDGLWTVSAASTRSKLSQVVAVPVLLAVALSLGASMRVYFADLAFVEGPLPSKLWRVGERTDVKLRQLTANFFLKEMPVQPAKQEQPIIRNVTEVARLIPNRDRIRSFGEIREPVPGKPGMYRLTEPGAPLSPNAVIVIRDRLAARATAVEMSEIWIEAMESRDELYPHIPQIAEALYEWYDLLQQQARDTEQRKAYIEKLLYWAEEGVRRSPRQAWYHSYLGKALLVKGTTRRGEDAIRTYYDAIDSYRHATELFPVADVFWSQYGEALLKVGDAFVRSGMTEEGEGLLELGREAKARARELAKQHAETAI